MIVAGTLLNTLRGGPWWQWMQWWQMWLIVGVTAFLMSRPLSIQTQSAGAEWFQWTHRRWWQLHKPETVTIHLYDLVEISSETHGPAKHFILLEDKHGNYCEMLRHNYQRDPRIWSLIYNGILHSIANGAEVDSSTAELLELDKTPVMSIREENEKNNHCPNRYPAARYGRHSM